jgi:VanZ family protein
MLLSYLTRKTAHLVVYAVLAALWLGAFLKSDGVDYRKAILFTVLISLFCAVADEYHQSLLSDRTAKFSDVALDVAAASLSLSIINIGIKKRRTRAASKLVL